MHLTTRVYGNVFSLCSLLPQSGPWASLSITIKSQHATTAGGWWNNAGESFSLILPHTTHPSPRTAKHPFLTQTATDFLCTNTRTLWNSSSFLILFLLNSTVLTWHSIVGMQAMGHHTLKRESEETLQQFIGNKFFKSYTQGLYSASKYKIINIYTCKLGPL